MTTNSNGRSPPGVHGGPDRIKVGVAELAVATAGETLTTSGLGSCVAVALHDERAGVRGLLHAMLPAEADGSPGRAPAAKYVDTGVGDLLESLSAAGASPGRVDARLVGGAKLIDVTGGSVGRRNVEAAQAVLQKRSIPVVASDVGGETGRTVRFEAEGRLRVRAADGFERVL
ncbi:MAG: chemotaxis protein CheD [Halopenitus sp.]